MSTERSASAAASRAGRKDEETQNGIPAQTGEIYLKVGDPDLDWASHTSLILPFAYQVSRLPHAATRETRPHWELVEIIEDHTGPSSADPATDSASSGAGKSAANLANIVFASDRRKYFTSDTSYVLFGRSRRFRLRHAAWPPHLHLRLGKGPTAKDITLRLAAAELWLFEAEKGLSAAAASRDDPLCCAQLRQEFSIEAGAEPFTLTDLLQLNEQLRFLRELYVGDGSRPLSLPSLRPEGRRIDFWLELLKAPLRPFGDDPAEPWLQLLPTEQIAALENHWESSGARQDSWLPPPGGRAARAVQSHGFALVHDDDRAYVWSTAILDPDKSGAPTPGVESAAWSALLNVDSSMSGQTDFMREWVRQHTYHRWSEAGTLYGFTTYSGVMLAKPFRIPAWQHMRTIYLDQTRLLLYLRSVIFVFSSRLVRLSAQLRRVGPRSGTERRRLQKEAQDLLNHMSQFVNLYQFPLLSNQQQGLELYALQRSQLDIDELFEEVRREAEDTHRFLSTLHAQDQQKFADIVQRVGVPIAVMGVINSLLALKFFEPMLAATTKCLTDTGGMHLAYVLPTALIVLLGLGAGLLLQRRNNGDD